MLFLSRQVCYFVKETFFAGLVIHTQIYVYKSSQCLYVFLASNVSYIVLWFRFLFAEAINCCARGREVSAPAKPRPTNFARSLFGFGQQLLRAAN